MKLQDRKTAGRLLAKKLTAYKNRDNTVIAALPRGGVPVAHEIAKLLHLALSIIVVHKLGVPLRPEFAFGAVASDGTVFIDTMLTQAFALDQKTIMAIAKIEMKEVLRRQKKYSPDAKKINFSGRTVILVDDGIATGATIKAAILSLRKMSSGNIIIAVPVCPKEIVKDLQQFADRLVCLESPKIFSSVSQFYVEFPQVTDEEVTALLFGTCY